jgi:flagellar motility protein MotE (MotC chaperone)
MFAQSVDCTKVFEDRKQELVQEVDIIDEARQSFEALKAATNALFDKQKAKLDGQRRDISASLDTIKQKEAKIKKMLEKNRNLLEAIKGAKNDKISKTYNKMKDSAAASIIAVLPVDSAAAIMFTLPAKKVSKIMAKMDPTIAAKVTQRISVGPPFDTNKSK